MSDVSAPVPGRLSQGQVGVVASPSPFDSLQAPTIPKY